MSIISDLAIKTWNFLSYLNYALFELLIAEVIGLTIEKTRHFKKSEYYVFSTILVGIVIFFMSGIFQELIISYLIILNGWLFLLFFFIFSIDILVLAKFGLERRWGFRLVLIPLVIIILIVIFFFVYSFL